MEYLIIDPERTRENNQRYYWKPNSYGYTNKIEEAGRYTLAEVKVICKNVDDYWITAPVFEPPDNDFFINI